MYKCFDPNINYDIINKTNRFKPTMKWWNYKCFRYYDQDVKFKYSKSPLHDLDRCVCSDDIDEFMKIYNDKELCKYHLCSEYFTYKNRPTLNKINNDIGHELSNCKLACEVCNRLRSKNDPQVTHL